MKNIILVLMVFTVFSCNQLDTKKSNMEKATIVEMVTWKSVHGISPDQAKELITKLNDFLSSQPGFVSRKTSIAKDGKFLDLVFWTDLKSAKSASEKAMKTEELLPIFNTIDQKEMTFQHFEIFNELEN